MTVRCCELPFPEQACCGEEEVSVGRTGEKLEVEATLLFSTSDRSQRVGGMDSRSPPSWLDLLSLPWASSFCRFHTCTFVSHKESHCAREACTVPGPQEGIQWASQPKEDSGHSPCLTSDLPNPTISASHPSFRNKPSLKTSVVPGGTPGKILLSAATCLLGMNKPTVSIPTT